jgi:hypothetical protein
MKRVGQKEANSKRGGIGFSLISNIGTFPPESFVYLPMISTIPGNEENHGPASRHHNDPGPTNTNLQGGLVPKGSLKEVAGWPFKVQL